MLEDTSELIERYQSFLEYSEEVSRELESSAPDSLGQRLRVETIEQEWVARYGIKELILQNQLWDNQINMYGQKLPAYKPDTLRRKRKKFGSWDKTNYVYYDTGHFADYGIIIEVDAAEDKYLVRLPKEFYDEGDPDKYFEYIRDHGAIGWTEENFNLFQAFLDDIVRDAQYDKYIELITEAGYGDFI